MDTHDGLEFGGVSADGLSSEERGSASIQKLASRSEIFSERGLGGEIRGSRDRDGLTLWISATRGGTVRKKRQRECEAVRQWGDTKTLSCTFHLANQTAQIRPPELGLASSVRNRILGEGK